MSILHIAFYPSDWLAGTRGLSDSETGIYITLIARMYEMASPIDRDDDRLSRLCGCKSKASFKKALSYLISEGKITESNGCLFNDRVAKEIEKVTEKSTAAKSAAKARWDKKPKKNKAPTDADASDPHFDPETGSVAKIQSKLDQKVIKSSSKNAEETQPDFLENTNEINEGDDANAPPTHMRNGCQLEPELDIKEETNVSSKNSVALRFDEFWNVVPRKVGKGRAKKAFASALKKTDAETIISGMRRYAEIRSGEDERYTAHPASWLNDERWTDAPPAPQLINGENHGNPSHGADRLRRTVTAAAEGTSGKNWG